MDEMIKKAIGEIIEKAKADPDMLAKVKADPAAAVKDLLGIDIPEDGIEAVKEAIGSELDISDIGRIAGIAGKLFD